VVLAWAWWRARQKFIGEAGAMVRLEVYYGLQSGLSTAAAGRGPWPQVPAGGGNGLRWRWGRVGGPPLLALATVAAALVVPVAGKQAKPQPAEPAAWGMIEVDLETMVEQRIVDESSTRETKETLESLRARPPGEWFNHSSLEATDRILLTHRRELSTLENQMRETARALRSMAESTQGLTPGREGQSERFEEMLEGMRSGGLRPDAEMMEKLEAMAEEGFSQLEPQQLAEMMEKLQENAAKLAEMMKESADWQLADNDAFGQGGQGEGEGEGWGGDGEGEPQPGDGGEGGEEGGQGAPQRGPGGGGPLFGDRKTEIDADMAAPLMARDLSRATPGDMIGTDAGEEHNYELESPTIRSGGPVAQPGDGGATVWRESLHPREQEAVKRFFD